MYVYTNTHFCYSIYTGRQWDRNRDTVWLCLPGHLLLFHKRITELLSMLRKEGMELFKAGALGFGHNPVNAHRSDFHFIVMLTCFVRTSERADNFQPFSRSYHPTLAVNRRRAVNSPCLSEAFGNGWGNFWLLQSSGKMWDNSAHY